MSEETPMYVVKGERIRPLPTPEHDPDELRAFLRVVHRALRMVCAYLERRYSL